MNKLEEARKIINEVDKEVAALFQKRMQAVEDVILYKLENDMPIFDSGREKQVIEKNCAYITEEKYIESYKEFIQNLMDTSKRYQASIINKGVVAYQGTMGAFSHIASKKVFPDSKLKSYATFEDVFKAVADGEQHMELSLLKIHIQEKWEKFLICFQNMTAISQEFMI